MARYAVVAFEEENEVSVVPSGWLTNQETKCYWPPYRNTAKLAKAIKERNSPEDNWCMYAARVLSKCDDFNAARRMSRKAECQSDLQSEGEYGRGFRRIQKRKLPDSDSDSWSSASTVDLPSKYKLPPPPAVSDLPPLQRANAMVVRPALAADVGVASTSHMTPHPVASDDTFEKTEDMAVILRAVARCETTIEDSTKMMNKKLDDILQKLNDMKNKEPSSGNKEFSAVDKVMPIGTQEDFNRVNDHLDLDVNYHDLMYHRLVHLGGTSVKTAVKFIMNTVMTNEMQTKFNWEGRVGWKTKANEYKTGFKKTKICSVITRALLANNNFITTEDEIGKTIMKYLRNASDRCGGRIRRLHATLGSSEPV